ncbi:hypothetical protein C2E23DRAFT_887834 [Lenzites betulinus]|nr:hypothetical protein C2E23DRAFT_887834 [Lenzites betulinus]
MLAVALPAAPFDHAKLPRPHLFLRQQHTVEVIQLVEVPAPPPRSHISSFASSSFASSSDCSSTAESDDDESVCSSYCSSDDDDEHMDTDPTRAPAYDDTYHVRFTRVLAWREGFSKAADAQDPLLPAPPPPSPVSSAPSSSPSRKRKAESDISSDFFDDASSQSSKRSRSIPPPERPYWQQRRLSAHACPACDAGFASLEGLQQHGSAALSNDACREAVQYGLEP